MEEVINRTRSIGGLVSRFLEASGWYESSAGKSVQNNLATQQSWIQATYKEIASGIVEVVEPFCGFD
jgi:hypothetical protein